LNLQCVNEISNSQKIKIGFADCKKVKSCRPKKSKNILQKKIPPASWKWHRNCKLGEQEIKTYFLGINK
jgi:hypothetical protein